MILNTISLNFQISYNFTLTQVAAYSTSGSGAKDTMDTGDRSAFVVPGPWNLSSSSAFVRPAQTIRCPRSSKRVVHRVGCQAPHALLHLDSSSIVLARDMVTRVAIGGLGIMGAGVVGTVFVGLLVRINYDVVCLCTPLATRSSHRLRNDL